MEADLVYDGPTTGVHMIAEERLRQITAEGYDEAHDDHHIGAELVAAAACYLMANFRLNRTAAGHAGVPTLTIAGKWTRRYHGTASWPFADEDWKPVEDDTRNLVIAGALIAAEIDRRLRTQR